MHECTTCGTVCDCDGEDTWGLEPEDHSCINPDCEANPYFEPVDDDDEDEDPVIARCPECGATVRESERGQHAVCPGCGVA